MANLTNYNRAMTKLMGNDMTKKTGLELLREPFPANLISKLPKPTKAQTDAVKADFKVGVRCEICGGYHHPKVVHLDYVGHAALTDRLLDADPQWNWEPMALTPEGLPVLDKDGGMWIKLTVDGVTRLGYGDAQGKTGGDAMKERIGDGLRNAAMRFGAALDLWHKGDLHAEEPLPPSAVEKAVAEITADQKTVLMDMIKEAGMTEAQFLVWGKIDSIDGMPANRYHNALAALEKRIFDNKGEKK